MYKLRPFLPLKVMKNVYYSLIYSHIVYAIEVDARKFPMTNVSLIFSLHKTLLGRHKFHA